MKQKVASGILALLMCLQSSCVHVDQSDEIRDIKVPADSQLQRSPFHASDVDYVIYRTSRLPLSDFFTRLRRGDYKKAFQKIDFRYRSTNFDDDALMKLIDAGFVPVYVRVKNTGTTDLALDEKSFLLTNEKEPKPAFYSDQLPKAFSEIQPSAIAANVYNTGVVVIGFAAVMAVFIMTMRLLVFLIHFGPVHPCVRLVDQNLPQTA